MRMAAVLLLVLVGCGRDPVATIYGSYSLSASSCTIEHDGSPSVARLDGEIEIDDPVASSPDGCDALLTITAEPSCSGCAGPVCRVCLRSVQEERDQVFATLGVASSASTECQFQQPRGGAATDLIFFANTVSGTFDYDAGSITLELTSDGDARAGVGGAESPSSAECSIVARRD